MLQVIERRWRCVATAGTGTVIHLINADGSAAVTLVKSPLFTGRHSISLTITVVMVDAVVDGAVSAVIRTAGIRVQ